MPAYLLGSGTEKAGSPGASWPLWFPTRAELLLPLGERRNPGYYICGSVEDLNGTQKLSFPPLYTVVLFYKIMCLLSSPECWEMWLLIPSVLPASTYCQPRDFTACLLVYRVCWRPKFLVNNMKNVDFSFLIQIRLYCRCPWGNDHSAQGGAHTDCGKDWLHPQMVQQLQNEGELENLASLLTSPPWSSCPVAGSFHRKGLPWGW